MPGPGLTLLTATGARPLAWSLCQQWMAHQDYAGPVHWIIVDDGPEPQPLAPVPAGWTVDLIRPHPLWQPGQNTQARNLQLGMRAVGNDARLAIIEDDDWYSPQWLSTVATWLERADLVGECRNRYWHVGVRGALQHNNTRHASLCATALKGPAMAAFRALLSGPARRFYDLQLWRRFSGRKHLSPCSHIIGLKGLPGRPGVCSEHTNPKGMPDPTGATLTAWAGPDDAQRILGVMP